MTTNPPDAIVKKDEHEEGGQMTFFEHLVELRKRLINSLIAIGAGSDSFDQFAPAVWSERAIVPEPSDSATLMIPRAAAAGSP